MARYAELQATSNFTFLEGASHPRELMLQAAALGLEAIAVTDRNSFAGIVRAHEAAKKAGMRLLVGTRLDLVDGASLLAYPTTRAAYGLLCRLITLGRRAERKKTCRLRRQDVLAHVAGSVLAVIPPETVSDEFAGELRLWNGTNRGMVHLALTHRSMGEDAERLARLAGLAAACDVPTVATNDVLMHAPDRRPLADVLTCIREGCTVDTAGFRLLKNAERHLKPAAAMAALFRDHPEALANTLVIAERCRFSLDELKYEYPDEIVTEGRTPQQELAALTAQGARERYPQGVPAKVQAQIAHELALIEELNYAPYFLTVQDIVAFARNRRILCQGRGSAANSTVCFCLGITSIPPDQFELLFERFISSARGEPPDIDVDFEHERREEVIQYIYRKYGRERAGLAATVIHYRARRAVREVGKALGLSRDTVAALAGQVWGWSQQGIDDAWVRSLGLDPAAPRLRLALDLSAALIGFPRHLSQHVGGFVIARGRLDESVPIENASMPERTVIQWDKDDLDAMKMLKVDVLSLGMLTCLRKGFELIQAHHGRQFDLATIPQDDPQTYDMLCVADSIGVFQVESRAQMSFLPRMKPRKFYDLVIEVAIVRPGPIQGDMVHPYLRRRDGKETVTYPSPDLQKVLERTLGVPLFQEQAMQIAIVGAGFTADKADRLRRAMATFRHVGTVHSFRKDFIAGMVANGYARDFAERCFRQIEGFGEYGFPESHAASFALLAYASAWMKRHYPAAFACALLNSQPMGFYAPAQIVRDAREHGVEVRPVDINHSHWDCTLEPGMAGLALRLGFRQIRGLSQEDTQQVVDSRGNGYPDPVSLWRRAGVAPAVLETLAKGDAFGSMGLARRPALWAVKRIAGRPLPLFEQMGETELAEEAPVSLPEMLPGEQVVADYQALCLSLKCHPLALLRPGLTGVAPAGTLMDLADGAAATVCGLVLVRQRPGSAQGVIFLTLEDETGVANIVVWPDVYERFRREVMTGRLLRVSGRLQKAGIVIHVVAERMENRSSELDALGAGDRFAPPFIPADELASGRSDAARKQKPSRLSREGPARSHPRAQAKVLFPSRDFH
ncbi:MAG: error-prone DNA polymerase [Alphaproteobacteria bacterium]